MRYRKDDEFCLSSFFLSRFGLQFSQSLLGFKAAGLSGLLISFYRFFFVFF